jgi:pSer/pThr/pTyr-binding forkhead associated (FHA) protein
MDEVECPHCGSENPPDANFCSVCGGVLDRTEEQHTENLEAVPFDPTEAPTLVIIRGPNAGSRFALTEAVTTIGRHPDSGVFLDDVTVSRRHAEIRRTMSGFEVVDVGSLNGTYVNGSRIESSPLADGDQLQVGKYKVAVVYGDGDGDGD